MTGSSFSHVFGIYWPIAVGVFIVVWVAVLGAAYLFRAERVGDRWPTGKTKSTPLEVGYAVLLACVVAMLLYFTYTTMNRYVNADAATNGERVDVTGAQWNWRFSYPKYGIVSQGTGAGRNPAVLTVPADTPIHFRGTSDDVIHSFDIPHERFQWQVFPRRTTWWTMSFPSSWIGRHHSGGQCVQFCGLYHSFMKFDIQVLSRQAFRQWVRQHRTTGASTA